MRYDPFLFIGGTLDGEFRVIEDPPYVLCVAEFSGKRDFLSTEPELIEPLFGTVEYLPQMFAADGKVYNFYVKKGMKSSEVLELLMRTYNESKSNKRRSR